MRVQGGLAGRGATRASGLPRALAGGLMVALLGAALPAASVPTKAASAFRVTVDLFTQSKNTALCDRSTIKTDQGPEVTLTCTADQRPRETESRFLLHLYRGQNVLGTVDGSLPVGTITSWRVVNFANRDYLEIVVGW